MDNRTVLKEMFVMQQRLNDETNGVGWEDGRARNGKLISWKRCIYMECAELIDSFSWKHWKDINALPSYENISVELADIWHFIMSLILEKEYKNKSIDGIVEDVSSVSGFSEFCMSPYKMSEYNMYEIINDIEIIIHSTSGFGLRVHDLLTNYFRLCLKCELNLASLYEIYVGKNVLNKFRQEHGYQEGTYIKKWNGTEDNVVLSEILNSGVLEIEEIYKELEKRYPKN
ncbi:MAG: dUTPase [Campylobacteraceae bacterium]|nr:dUTPase [Campylobacteraceae bacterium]